MKTKIIFGILLLAVCSAGIPAAAQTTKTTLTVTADDQSRYYGDPNPVLTITYSGFVNGDTEASLTVKPTAVVAATPSSLVGTYPITASGGVSGKYDFNYVAGILTVKNYYVFNPAVTASDIVYGQTLASSTISPASAVSASDGSPVTGSWAWDDNSIKPNAGDQNFTATFTPTDPQQYKMQSFVTVHVAPVLLTITKSIASLQASPIGRITLTVNGIVSGDGYSDIFSGINSCTIPGVTCTYDSDDGSGTFTFDVGTTADNASASGTLALGLTGNYSTSDNLSFLVFGESTGAQLTNPIQVNQVNVAAFNSYAGSGDGLSKNYGQVEDITLPIPASGGSNSEFLTSYPYPVE